MRDFPKSRARRSRSAPSTQGNENRARRSRAARRSSRRSWSRGRRTRDNHTRVTPPSIAQIDHPLTPSPRIADEIGGDRQFAVPVAARHPRIVIRQMHETRVPTEFVKAGCPAAIALITRRHERVQHQYCRRAPAACAREKICASDVVRRKFGADRTAPSDRRAVADLTHESAITRNSVKIVRRKFLAFSHINLKL